MGRGDNFGSYGEGSDTYTDTPQRTTSRVTDLTETPDTDINLVSDDRNRYVVTGAQLRRLASDAQAAHRQAMCKGSVMLGSACGRCSRCQEAIRKMPELLKDIREQACGEFMTALRIIARGEPGAALNAAAEDHKEMYEIIQKIRRHNATNRWNIKPVDEHTVEVCKGEHAGDEECTFERFISTKSVDLKELGRLVARLESLIEEKDSNEYLRGRMFRETTGEPVEVRVEDEVNINVNGGIAKPYVDRWLAHATERCARCFAVSCVPGCGCECHRRDHDRWSKPPAPSDPAVVAAPPEARTEDVGGRLNFTEAARDRKPELGLLRYRPRAREGRQQPAMCWTIVDWESRNLYVFRDFSLRLTLGDGATVEIELDDRRRG